MSFTITDAYHIVAVVSIFFGFLLAFFGVRLFRLFLALTGFVIVGLFGFVVVYYFITPNIIAGTIVGSILAIFGSIIMAHYTASGAFIIGSVFGTLLSVILIASFSCNYMQEDDTRVVTILGFAIMLGILATHYRRIAIVGGTSILGSYGLVAGIDNFVQSGFNSILPSFANGRLSEITITPFFYVFIVAFVVSSAVAVFIQYRQMAKFDTQLYPGEEFESYNSSNFESANNSRLPTVLSKLSNLFNRKKVDDVPLLDVVSLEDY